MQLNNTIRRIIFIAALAIIIAGYNLYKYAWHGFFYHCLAVFVLLLMVLLKDLCRHDKWLHKISVIGFWLAANNLMDELFFDPQKLQWNEYVFAAIIIFLTLKKSNNAR